jgi:hypothetical protein
MDHPPQPSWQDAAPDTPGDAENTISETREPLRPPSDTPTPPKRQGGPLSTLAEETQLNTRLASEVMGWTLLKDHPTDSYHWYWSSPQRKREMRYRQWDPAHHLGQIQMCISRCPAIATVEINMTGTQIVRVFIGDQEVHTAEHATWLMNLGAALLQLRGE